MAASTGRSVGQACGGPAILAGVISAPRIKGIVATPDDHHAPGPNRRMALPALRRSDGSSQGPAIGGRIILAAGVVPCATVYGGAAPDNHLAAAPNGGVAASCRRRARGVRSRPCVGGRIVTASSVEDVGARAWVGTTAPDDH